MSMSTSRSPSAQSQGSRNGSPAPSGRGNNSRASSLGRGATSTLPAPPQQTGTQSASQTWRRRPIFDLLEAARLNQLPTSARQWVEGYLGAESTSIRGETLMKWYTRKPYGPTALERQLLESTGIKYVKDRFILYENGQSDLSSPIYDLYKELRKIQDEERTPERTRAVSPQTGATPAGPTSSGHSNLLPTVRVAEQKVVDLLKQSRTDSPAQTNPDHLAIGPFTWREVRDLYNSDRQAVEKAFATRSLRDVRKVFSRLGANPAINNEDLRGIDQRVQNCAIVYRMLLKRHQQSTVSRQSRSRSPR